MSANRKVDLQKELDNFGFVPRAKIPPIINNAVQSELHGDHLARHRPLARYR